MGRRVSEACAVIRRFFKRGAALVYAMPPPDTVDKVDPQYFRQCVAAMAVMGYVLADMP